MTRLPLRQRLKRHLPSAEQLARVKWLRPLAHRLADPRLWRGRAEPLARGAAIGIFWAFAIPVAQIVLAAAHCIWWRANIPLAAAITFITNPFTVGGWLVLAYQVGSFLVPGNAGAPPTLAADGMLALLRAFGAPTLVGMGVFAFGGALLGYLLVRAGAGMWFHWRLAGRSRRQAARRRAAP